MGNEKPLPHRFANDAAEALSWIGSELGLEAAAHNAGGTQHTRAEQHQ
jgi:hypothetical protein